MLKDFRMGNPHALDYCLPANPPKALYTPPRERRSALQQALDAAGDAFTTGRSRIEVAGTLCVLTADGWRPLCATPEPAQPVEPREFRVGDRVVAIDGCAPWYHLFQKLVAAQRAKGQCAKNLRHEGAAL